MIVLCTVTTIKFNVARGSRTILVPTDYLTIQSAINNAAEGDTVFVYGGTYSENVIVNKTISLTGENKTTTFVNGGGTGVVVEVTADSVFMTGFTIGNGSFADGGAAISLYKVRSVSLIDNAVVSSYLGMGLLNSSAIIVQSNYMLGCNTSLFMNFSDSNTIQGNTFANAAEAVQMIRSSNNTIVGNIVSNCSFYGVHLKYSSQNKLQGNEIYGSENGLLLEYSPATTLSTNDMHSNRFNFGVIGDSLFDYIHSVDVSNRIAGKSLYYLVNMKDMSLNETLSQNVGYLAIVNSSNVRANSLDLSNNGEGFLFAYSTDCSIEDSNMTNNKRAAFVYNSPRCSIINDHFTSSSGGISILSSPTALVKNSTIVETGDYGLTLEASQDSVIEGNSVEHSIRGGLSLYSSPNCNIRSNTFVSNGFGIFVQVSTGVNIYDNVVANNTGNGVNFSYSDNSSAQGNSVSGNDGYGVVFQAVQFASAVNNLLKNNTQSGIYMYGCFLGQVNSNVIEYNQVGITLQSSLDTKIDGNQVLGNVHEGILLMGSPSSDVGANTVLNNSWEGMSFQNSANSTLNANVVYHNMRFGIWLQDSPQVTILNSNVSSNALDGIYLRGSDGSRILNSVLNGNGDAGCRLFFSDLVALGQNNITNNREGVRIFLSNDNTINDNRLLKNIEYGINIYNSTRNKLYHNNFINNTVQNAKVLNASSVWDDSYPDGGNYWSDYLGLDSYWGPKQDQPGADGIGDTPHIIDSDNMDKYPLVIPARFHDLSLEKLVLPSNEVYVGWVFSVNVTVKNVGGYVENANVSAYYGGLVIQTRQLNNLTVGSSSTVSMLWDTSSLPQCRTYDVKAEVTIVAGDTHIEDNIYDFGLVKVKVVGDVNSDGKINILDIFAIATAFGSKVGGSNYKINYDMNLDHAINILDLAKAALNFNKVCLYRG
jgi:parallel beta-helix repeat protein